MVQYRPQLDETFAALADPTRRGILEHLARRDASISDLAAAFEITLTGIKKQVHMLERSGLVTTEKVGRVRNCRLGRRSLKNEARWLSRYQQTVEARFNRLEDFLE